MLEATHGYRCIDDVRRAIDDGVSVRRIVEDHLDAIKELNGELNAIAKLDSQALIEADRLDGLHPTQRGRLHGVPIVVKDQIETAGIRTAYGSIACEAHIPSRDATLIAKLRAAGAVILGKSTMPDWGASWFSPSSLTGTTANPHDASRDPGGSSSGSGAAVASGMAVAAIGGDTSGSIRLPSSFCGLVGVRVTPGEISRDGMSALYTLQDTPGPMARNVQDVATLLDVMVGVDKRDHYTSISAISPRNNFFAASQSPSLADKRVGVLREMFGSHEGIHGAMETALLSMTRAGAKLIDIEIPELDYFMTATSVSIPRLRADISDFLASRNELANLTIEGIARCAEVYKSLDLIGTIAKAFPSLIRPGELDRATDERTRFQRVVAGIFADLALDAIVYPTCRILAPKTEEVLHGRSEFEKTPITLQTSC
jgi:amidase